MARKPKVEKLVDENLPIPDPPVIDPTLIARDTEMFEKWKKGTTLTALAAEYGMTHQAVSEIKRKYNWHGLVTEMKRRAFQASFTQLKDMAVNLVKLAKHDIGLLTETAIKEKRQLTKEERGHVVALLDRIWKEVRLEDGKPTENTGVLSVELRLPPGVKHYGIIPPDPRVKYVTAEVEDAKPVIDIDALEEKERGGEE